MMVGVKHQLIDGKQPCDSKWYCYHNDAHVRYKEIV